MIIILGLFYSQHSFNKSPKQAPLRGHQHATLFDLEEGGCIMQLWMLKKETA